MAAPREKLAESLAVLHNLQKECGEVAIKTSEIKRIHRERLQKNGFLKKVAKGWYITSNPTEKAGDNSSWHTSFWQFCSRYLKDKYDNEYFVSPEQSVLIHSGNTTIPQQLVIKAKKAPNKNIPLLYGTSILEMKSLITQRGKTTEKMGLKILTLPAALVHSSPTLFEKNPIDARVGLAQISDASEMLHILLNGSHSIIAGRIAGAFRNIGQNRIADDILKAMKSAAFDVREKDPFRNESTAELSFREKSPYANRIRLMWRSFREHIIHEFPKSPGIPKDIQKHLKQIDEIYVTDAYHSLSIEHYVVSVELIEKVRSGDWHSTTNQKNKTQRDAMAARGYWQASQKVKSSIEKILNGANPAKVVNDDHQNWYQESFAPSVMAGILKPSDLAGYRSNPVYISNSKHVPLNKEAVREAMPLLFELLENEEHSSVRAVLGHFIFVFIHPYSDGNGRMGRFLMNVMLASGGYPWTVIPNENRDAYMDALETASVANDIGPLTQFIADLVRNSLKGSPMARL